MGLNAMLADARMELSIESQKERKINDSSTSNQATGAQKSKLFHVEFTTTAWLEKRHGVKRDEECVVPTQKLHTTVVSHDRSLNAKHTPGVLNAEFATACIKTMASSYKLTKGFLFNKVFTCSTHPFGHAHQLSNC